MMVTVVEFLHYHHPPGMWDVQFAATYDEDPGARHRFEQLIRSLGCGAFEHGVYTVYLECNVPSEEVQHMVNQTQFASLVFVPSVGRLRTSCRVVVVHLLCLLSIGLVNELEKD